MDAARRHVRRLFFFCNILLSIDVMAYRFDLHVEVQSDRETLVVDAATELISTGSCFYVSFKNPDFRHTNKLEERLSFNQNRRNRPLVKGGEFEFLEKNRELDWITPYVFKVQGSGNFTFKFRARLPHFETDSSEQRYYYEFYPQKLAHCPHAKSRPESFSILPLDDVKLNLSSVDDGVDFVLPYAHPARKIAIQAQTPEVAFAVLNTAHQSKVRWRGTTLYLHFDDQDFLQLLPTFLDSLEALDDWVHPLNLPALHFIEATQFERDNLPGLILINRPTYQGLADFQSKWLNWAHWASVMLICRQWFGAFIRAASLDEEWLMRGNAEFLSWAVLKDYETRFDLFNLFGGAYSLLDLNYRQMHDLLAMLLFQNDPGARLTDDQFLTHSSYAVQHPMLPLRHTIALRHIQGRFQKIQQEFLRISSDYIYKSMTASQFSHEMPEKIQPILNHWWTATGWPDFEIVEHEFRQFGDQWQVSLVARDKNEFNPDVSFTVTDVRGAKHRFDLARAEGSLYRGFVSIDFEPAYLVIDEERLVFDTDRYNNTTQLPSVFFFPGNAKGIPDDGYTLVWLPYPFRRPGQEWALGIRSGLYRYINSATTLNAEQELQGQKRTAFEVQHSFRWPELRSAGLFTWRQDFFGSRVSEFSNAISPLFDYHQTIGLAQSLRWRQIVGADESQHATVALRFSSEPKISDRYVGYKVFADIEKSLPTAEFRYQRLMTAASLAINFPKIFDLQLRVFSGRMFIDGDVDDEFLFNPQDLNEAHLRAEPPGGTASTSMIDTINYDVRLPSFLPLKDSGVFSISQLRWRLYYDLGIDREREAWIRGAGYGIEAPMGGDLTGVGKLALTDLSLMVIGFSAYNQERSYRPKILFSFTGEL